MKLNRFRIGQRLLAGFGLMALLLVIMVFTAHSRLHQTEQVLTLLVELERRGSLAEEWKAGTELNANRALAIGKSGYAKPVVDYFDPQVKATTARINEVQKELEGLIDSDKGKAFLLAIAEERKAYIGIRNAVFDKMKGGDVEGGQAQLDREMLPVVRSYVGKIEELSKYQHQRVISATESASASIQTTENLLYGMLAACLLVAALAGTQITRSVTAPLQQARSLSDAIADGDLRHSVEAEGRDEVAQLLGSLAQMQAKLRSVVGEIRAGTDSISTASREVATGSQDLSQRTEQTAGNLQQAASSLEQITATARSASDSAAQANQLAASAAQVAQRGGSVVEQVVTTMSEIDASAKRIADIIGTIDGIAFQTNILALNAAVEAARAGEQGRGFAVVAGEVRALAGRSAEAAKEIKALISSSVDKVEAGSKLVADAGATMQEIVASVQRVTDIIGEISSAAGEQSSGIALVNGSVNELDQMTQQNAALVEESAAAAESLSEQASRVAASVAVFKT